MHPTGELDEVFHNESDFIRQGIQRILSGDERQNHILIVDKNKIFNKPAMEIRDQKLVSGNISIVSILHAAHTVNHNDVYGSRTNSNCLDILESNTQPDAIITLTDQQRSHVAQRYGKSNLITIPHSYNASLLAETAHQRQRHTAVYLARYSAEKRHELAIQAFAKVAEAVPDAKLQCYGQGSKLPALKKLVKELNLEHNVFLNGWTSPPAKAYEEAGLTLLTSQAESFSLTILESLSHGSPVVAFDVPYGPQDIIENGHNGYLVPFPDVEQLAEKIIFLMTCPDDLHAKLSMQARASLSRFSTQNVANKWKCLLLDLVS